MILGFPTVFLNRFHLVLLLFVSPDSNTMYKVNVVATYQFHKFHCRNEVAAHMHAWTNEWKENSNPPVPEAVFSRGGGGGQGQPVMSQEVAGMEDSGRLNEVAGSWRGILTTFLLLVTTTILAGPRQWRELGRGRTCLDFQKGQLAYHLCGRGKHFWVPRYFSNQRHVMTRTHDKWQVTVIWERGMWGSFGIQYLVVIQQRISLGLSLTAGTHFDLELDSQYLFLCCIFSLIAAGVQKKSYWSLNTDNLIEIFISNRFSAIFFILLDSLVVMHYQVQNDNVVCS